MKNDTKGKLIDGAEVGARLVAQVAIGAIGGFTFISNPKVMWQRARKARAIREAKDNNDA